MTTLEFEVSAEESGKRLDVVVAARAGVSRSVAAGLTVTVDSRAAAKSLRVESGQHVSVVLPPPGEPPQPEGIDVPVVYEDEWLLVLDKPAGLVVHPAPGHPGGTLVNALLARTGKPAGGEAWRPGIVHRLDASTSGLMIVAKTEAAFDALTGMIASRSVVRTYVALVKGVPSTAEATIEAPIGRSPRHRKKMAVVAGGKPAVTHFRVIEALGDVSVLEVTLETGRTHQIRVHLAEIGYPVVGDPVYGRSRSLAKRLGLDRPFLHAARLEFHHPEDGRAMSFESPLPPDLNAARVSARNA